MNNALFAADALLPSGWARNVLLQWDQQGRLTHVQSNATPAQGVAHASGPLLPGMPNLHSHAFQRAFAGLSEYRAAAQENFWSWRSLMYRFANRITPAQLEAIATWLYIEMLEAGYTSVCEFHYLHHDLDGRAYADASTLAQCILRAANATGIGLTLLPVLYQTSGFGAAAASAEQRRFIQRTDALLSLLQTLQPQCQAQNVRLGLAPHSLRAVAPPALQDALTGLKAIDAQAPIHIHIAEQAAEVQACIAWGGQRPVQWLLDHHEVNRHWCLVHATHMDQIEYQRAAQSGAVAGICPSTEANLGDGFFDLPRWQSWGGAWAIGSDSHILVNAAEEFMLLEYGQRLHRQQRNVLATPAQPHVATAMTLQALSGGAQASGRAIAGLAVGQQADFLTLNRQHLALAGLSAPDMLSAHVFASHRSNAIHHVWVGGQQRVIAAAHCQRETAQRNFIAAREALLCDTTTSPSRP